VGLSLPVEPLGRHQGVGSRFRSLYLHQIMELRLERSSGQENGVGFTKVFYTLSGIKTGQPCFPLLPSDPGSKRKGKSPAVHTQDGSAQYKHTTSGVLALTFTSPRLQDHSSEGHHSHGLKKSTPWLTHSTWKRVFLSPQRSSLLIVVSRTKRTSEFK